MSRHLEVGLKESLLFLVFFNPLLSIWIFDETFCQMIDIPHVCKLLSMFAKFCAQTDSLVCCLLRCTGDMRDNFPLVIIVFLILATFSFDDGLMLSREN